MRAGKAPDPIIIEEFARRREAYISKGYAPGLGIFLFGMALMAINFLGTNDYFIGVNVVAGIFCIYGFALITYMRHKWFRCPSCNKQIMSMGDGEDLSPEHCVYCCACLKAGPDNDKNAA